jgi:hypothetical protein
MVELGFSDMLSVAQTIGIVGTMVLTLYFSKRQIQSLSVDVEAESSMTWMKKFIEWAR